MLRKSTILLVATAVYGVLLLVIATATVCRPNGTGCGPIQGYGLFSIALIPEVALLLVLVLSIVYDKKKRRDGNMEKDRKT